MAAPTVGTNTTAAGAANPLTTTGITVTAGSAVLCSFVTGSGATITSVVGTGSETFTALRNETDTNNGVTLWVYYRENSAGSASYTVTITTVANNVVGVSVVEVDGAASSSIVDASAQAFDNSGAPFNNSLTSVSADTLFVAFALSGNATTGTYTANGGFTKIADSNSAGGVSASAYKSVATASANDPAWTHSNALNNHALVIVAIKGNGVAGPEITSVSTATPREGASLTITGTAFGASQGAGNSTINSVSQTETSWGDTSVVVTVVLGTNKFGAAYNVIVTDDGGTPSNTYAGITGLLPANSGLSYVDIGTPNTTSAYRLTSSADLASGDQVEYDNKGGEVTVASDGTFTAGPGVSSFNFRVWTSGSGYGPSATQLTSLGGGATDRPLIRPFNKRSGLGF